MSAFLVKRGAFGVSAHAVPGGKWQTQKRTVTTVEVRRPGGAPSGSQAFADAVAAAGDALESLGTRAQALAAVATSAVDVEIAQLALTFATRTGPRSLQRAKDTGDGGELVQLQNGIRGVTEDVTGDLVTDAVERFVLMALGGLLAGPFGIVAGAEVSPEALDELRERVNTIPTPPAPQDLPLSVFIATGAGLGALNTLTRTADPKMAAGGAVVGGLLGFLAHRAVRKLGDMLSVRKQLGV